MATPDKQPGRDVTAIIQARMGSSRLPGKVLKEVLGKPLLSYMIERVRDARRIHEIIVATTVNSEDDPIAELSEKIGVSVFRGSSENVLERFYKAAQASDAKVIMRLTADCPLIDPIFLDELVNYFFDGEYDYASNCNPPSLPDGLDAEIFSCHVLETAFNHAFLPSHLEHVTRYIRENGDIFRIGNWSFEKDLSGLRWTVDRLEDFQLIKIIFEEIYPLNRRFRTPDVMQLLASRPKLATMNLHIQRNEGMNPSFEADKEWFKKTIKDR